MILNGVAASQGVAEGPVKVVTGAEDGKKFSEGDVLVAEVFVEPVHVDGEPRCSGRAHRQLTCTG